MWLSWIVYLFFVGFVLVHLIRALIFLDLFQYPFDFQPIFEACFVPFLCVLSYFGVRQSQVFQEQLEDSSESKDIANEDAQDTSTKIETTTGRRFVLQDTQLDNYLTKLEHFVKTEKPYLNSNLTLGDLAKSLDMPKHHLTKTLNLKLQKNFFNYVNECRVAEFKALIKDPQYASQTIMSLAFQVGFNSKSAFNNFFKKSTNMTPTEFKKICSKKR
jgi:AraC-like DNA-binding protein